MGVRFQHRKGQIYGGFFPEVICGSVRKWVHFTNVIMWQQCDLCPITLDTFCWLLQKRHLLEDSNQLDARRSALDDDLEEMDEDEEEGEFKVCHGIFMSLAIFLLFSSIFDSVQFAVNCKHGSGVFQS